MLASSEILAVFLRLEKSYFKIKTKKYLLNKFYLLHYLFIFNSHLKDTFKLILRLLTTEMFFFKRMWPLLAHCLGTLYLSHHHNLTPADIPKK